jgi:hypothetical protein
VPRPEADGGDLGWVKTEISTIFEHPDSPRRRPEDHPRAHRDTKAEPEPTKRVFRDVTSVARPTVATGADAPADKDAPAEKEDPPASEEPRSDSLLQRLKRLEPGRLRAPDSEPDEIDSHEEALEDALDQELLTIADEVASAVTEPDPQAQPGLAQAVERPTPEPPSTKPQPEPQPKPQPTPKPKPKPKPTPKPTATLTEADHHGPWPIRVDDTLYDPVDEDALAALLKTGVWLAVIELQTDSGHWIPLEQHPVYPTVRERLLRQTQQIVEKVTTGEWQRLPATNDATSLQSPSPAAPGEVSSASRETEGTPQPTREPRPSLPNWLYPTLSILGGVALAVVSLAIVIPIVDKPQPTPPPATASPATAKADEPRPVLTIPPTSEPTDEDWRKAVAGAMEHVASAHRADTFASALIAEQRPEMAREVVLEAMIARGVKPHLKEAFNRAIAADPALEQKVITVGIDEKVDALYALGGGRSISLRMTRGGKNAFAFKPAQEEWGNGWRAEVASYLFCEIVPCHFEVPRNRPARISRKHFNELYGRVNGDWQTTYAERFGNLHWIEEPGPSGAMREYLYGTLKDWVPHFVDWPIEYTDVWDEWLDVRFHPANLDTPYAKAHEPLKRLADGQFHKKLLDEQGDATLRDVARQLSSILVFDYLTQNWDRFSTTEKYYGVNNQFADGTFISLDNGAAFYDEAVPEVGPRFQKTSRFSRSMITAVRALDPETINPILFPDADFVDRRRLTLFWEQREELLMRVDELIAHYGEARVLEFE